MYKLISLIFAFFLVFSAYFQFPEILQYDSKRILQLLLLILGGIVFSFESIQNAFSKKTTDRNVHIEPSSLVKGLITVMFFTGIISVILSPNFKYALLEFSFFFLLLALVYSLAPKNLNQHYLLGKLLFATALLYSGIYLTLFFGNYISSYFNPMIALWPEKYNFSLFIDGVELAGKEVLYFDNTRFFNHTQTWTLPILIGFLTYIKKQNLNLIFRGLLFTLISCWWMLLLVTTARGAIFGIVVSLLVLLVLWRKDVYSFVKNVFSTLLFGGVLYYLMFILPVDSVGQTIFRIESSRPHRFIGALEVWWQNPFFGLGPMHYAEIGGTQFVGHPHNFYLQILSEWGIFSFAALFCLMTIGFLFIHKRFFKIRNKSPNRLIYITFTWSILAGLIHAFFSGVMMTPLSQIWFVLIVTWFVGFNRNRSEKKLSFVKLNNAKIVYLLFLFITVYIVYFDVFNLSERYTDYLTDYPNRKFYPRFWVQGLFE